MAESLTALARTVPGLVGRKRAALARRRHLMVNGPVRIHPKVRPTNAPDLGGIAVLPFATALAALEAGR